jgi:hypothetical protein
MSENGPRLTVNAWVQLAESRPRPWWAFAMILSASSRPRGRDDWGSSERSTLLYQHPCDTLPMCHYSDSKLNPDNQFVIS